jgi:hypothetical protein
LLRNENPNNLATALDVVLERLAERLASRAAEPSSVDDDLDAEIGCLTAALANVFPGVNSMNPDPEVAAVLAEALSGRNLKPCEARALAAKVRQVIDAMPGDTGPSGGLSRRLRAAADELEAQEAGRLGDRPTTRYGDQTDHGVRETP